MSLNDLKDKLAEESQLPFDEKEKEFMDHWIRPGWANRLQIIGPDEPMRIFAPKKYEFCMVFVSHNFTITHLGIIYGEEAPKEVPNPRIGQSISSLGKDGWSIASSIDSHMMDAHYHRTGFGFVMQREIQ